MKIVKGKIINGGIILGRMRRFRTGEDFSPKDREPVIVFADELAPGDVLKLVSLGVSSFVMRVCSDNSHSAILTRTMDMPSLFGVDVTDEWEGELAVLDGYTGELTVAPDEAALAYYRERAAARSRERAALEEYRGRSSVTLSGREIRLCANINKFSDLELAIRNDAEGVFFKTEFLFIDSEDFPSEDDQLRIYREIAERMDGRLAVIRTIDIGADKRADYFRLDEEENPALGFRGIRLCLGGWIDVFKVQMRAILRASAYGNVAIMLPMIVSAGEVTRAMQILDEVKRELDRDGIPYDRAIKLGIMVETPAAAIESGRLAELVDFFSIGTNDLIQYTLAADRQNPKLAEVYDPYHPAVLSLVKYTVEQARANGIEVGISGELGADTTLTERLIDWGLTTLAVPPAAILGMRKHISEIK